MQIYVRQAGALTDPNGFGSEGPYGVDQINEKIRSGEMVGRGAFAWYEGCACWIALDRIPGVFMAHHPPAFSVGPPPAPSDATGGLIPYKNPMALTGYYIAVFSLIPGIGIPLGIVAVVLGIVGLRRRKLMPTIRGAGHAWVAIVLGSLSVVGQFVIIAVLLRG